MFVAKSGLCAVSVDYRLAPEHPYPIGHQDCYRVLRWIGENAASFGGDREHIFAAGDSAGGNLTQYCTTRDPANNPPTFLTVGEHDFLKLETLGYGVKLHRAGVETKMVLYKGFGHAYIDNTGIYPQCEDCIDEMVSFVLTHCQG